MTKKTQVIDYFWIGWKDGKTNNSKMKGLKGWNKKAYDNGYAEGHKERSKL